MSEHTAPPTHGEVLRWVPQARHLVATLVLGLALAVTACGSGTPIGGTSASHATPPPTQTPTPVPSPVTTWRIIPSPNPPSPPTSGLAAVSALTPTDAWAVGGTYTDCCRWRPLIEHWDGATWHIVPSSGTTSLQGVVALSPRDVWAVGSGVQTYAPVNGPTLIEHWNGTQWSIVPSPNPSGNDNSLASVAALAPNDVWAVGNYRSSTGTASWVHLPLIERWDGAAWHLVANPALPGAIDSTLAAVAPIPGTTQLWAVGSVLYDHPASHPALIERWDGTAWHLVAPAALPSDAARSGTLSGVVALSPTDAWAVGEYSASNLDRRALIEHWDGTAWQIVSSPDACASSMGNRVTTLLSVTAAGARDVRAVGSFAACSTKGRDQALIEQWDGTAWHLVATPALSGAHFSLNAVTTDGAGNCWAVGYSVHAAGNDSFPQTLIEHSP